MAKPNQTTNVVEVVNPNKPKRGRPKGSKNKLKTKPRLRASTRLGRPAQPKTPTGVAKVAHYINEIQTILMTAQLGLYDIKAVLSSLRSIKTKPDSLNE